MGFSNGLVSPWIKSLIKNLVKKEDRKKRKYYVTQEECYQKIRCIGTFEMVDHKPIKQGKGISSTSYMVIISLAYLRFTDSLEVGRRELIV
jgi:hypothetical protein